MLEKMYRDDEECIFSPIREEHKFGCLDVVFRFGNDDSEDKETDTHREDYRWFTAPGTKKETAPSTAPETEKEHTNTRHNHDHDAGLTGNIEQRFDKVFDSMNDRFVHYAFTRSENNEELRKATRTETRHAMSSLVLLFRYEEAVDAINDAYDLIMKWEKIPTVYYRKDKELFRKREQVEFMLFTHIASKINAALDSFITKSTNGDAKRNDGDQSEEKSLSISEQLDEIVKLIGE